MSRIARVFPRRTKATPDDDLVFINKPPSQPMIQKQEMDEVHVSVAFTWDIPRAEKLARAWEDVGVPVKIGGPAYGQPSGDFVPGLYLKHGYTFTSRGCPNNCKFCSVPGREGGLRELPITEGWNILDDNLLACSEGHIRAVFDMLKRQPQRPIFTGGLEAAQLVQKPWVVDLLRDARPERLYFAYDWPGEYEPLVKAGRLLRAGGFTQEGHTLMCYCLIGYGPCDTPLAAEKRLKDAWRAGFMPYAMMYRDKHGQVPDGWKDLYRSWSRPQMVAAQLKETEVMG